MRRNETPEGKSVRLLRVGEQVRHALSDILARGDVLIYQRDVAHIERLGERERRDSNPRPPA